MPTNTRAQNIIRAIAAIPHRAIHYLSGAVTRIFGPTDDEYPATGVQPYEGEPAKKKTF